MEGILTDEIGIEFALLGKYRARARYRPIYATKGAVLIATAVEGAMALTLDGKDVQMETMLGTDPSPAARQAYDLLALTLTVRNHGRSDAEALDLQVDFPVATGDGAQLALHMLEELAEMSGRVGQTTVFSPCADVEIIKGLRQAGYRVGIVARLNDEGLADRIAAAKPEIIRMDGGWLERSAENEPLAALLGRFVAICHDAGAQVMLPGVDESAVLRAGIDLEVDLFAGAVLGAGLSAGSVMEFPAIPVIGLRVANVLPYTGRLRAQ